MSENTTAYCLSCKGHSADDILNCATKSCPMWEGRVTSELLHIAHAQRDMNNVDKIVRLGKENVELAKNQSARPAISKPSTPARVTATKRTRKKSSVSSADVVTSMLICAAYSAAYAALSGAVTGGADAHKQAATATKTRYGCAYIQNTGR